jgi:hypothetical protein
MARETKQLILVMAAVAIVVALLYLGSAFGRPQVVSCIDAIDETPTGQLGEDYGPNYKPAITLQVELGPRKGGRIVERQALGCTFSGVHLLLLQLQGSGMKTVVAVLATVVLPLALLASAGYAAKDT